MHWDTCKSLLNTLGRAVEQLAGCLAQWRSQVTDDARALHTFFFFLVGGRAGWGHAPLVNFCILEVATQIVLETIFEMPSVLNRE